MALGGVELNPDEKDRLKSVYYEYFVGLCCLWKWGC